MMGADRWGQGSSASGTGGSAYRSSYHRGNYRGESNFGGYGNGNFGHGSMHYDNGAYDTSKVDRASSEHTTAIGQKSGAATKYASNSSGEAQNITIDSAITSAAALEKKIATAASEMSQALQEATSKENEKFDLIFSILMELQTRQSKLEESLKFLKAQFEGNCGHPQMMTHQVPMPSGQGEGLQGASPLGNTTMTSPMGSPMGSQVGMMTAQMGMVGGQMPMNQQCGNMIMMDSSGNCMVPVLMVMPQNGGQMQFTQMLMPQGTTMQGMSQQQVQFSGEGAESCGDFQWNGGMQANTGDASSTTAGGQHSTSSNGSGSGSGPGTARSTGEQPGSGEQ
eukprot:TRINITY_DN214_c0_g2_i1.p1 TRINITY_DN214_c0_g2~~TRINITY_DN214_c0_g2_i1.p1  ORF type:complete len:338 (-),score=72.45 TRINITY_DN214_c0_g2_i1:152-1165(-)